MWCSGLLAPGYLFGVLSLEVLLWYTVSGVLAQELHVQHVQMFLKIAKQENAQSM